MVKTPTQIGRWRIIGCLGKGGNAVVWKGVDEFGNHAAVKVLQLGKRGRKGYERFKREVETLRFHSGLRGILPYLDSYLPDSLDGDSPWLAMPVAEPLESQLVGASIIDKVGAISGIAKALMNLATKGIAHRDIKPSNLYWYIGEPHVGDFGLVQLPNKPEITATQERMGPWLYMAPEMWSDFRAGSRGDARPADVYSLAKTLWKIATNRRFPLQGEHRRDRPEALLESYGLSHPRLPSLNLLLEAMTWDAPSRRPSMSEVYEEFSSWLMEPPSDQPLTTVTQLKASIREIKRSQEQQLAPSRARASQAAQSVATAEQTLAELQRSLNDFREEALGAGLENAAAASGYVLRELGWRGAAEARSREAMIGVKFPVGPELFAGFAVRRSDASPGLACIAAVHFMMFPNGERKPIWWDLRKGVMGLPTLDQALREIVEQAKAAWPQSVENLVALCSDPPRATPGWNRAPDLTERRENFGLAGSVEGTLYAVGGQARVAMGPTHDVLSVEAFRSESGSWRVIGQLAAPRYGFGVATVDRSVAVIGGFGLGSSVERSVLVFDEESGRFDSGPELPEPRAWCTACALDGRIYLVGGVGPDHVPSRAVYSWRPGDSQWIRLHDLREARMSPGVCGTATSLWVAGGHDGTNALQTVERWDFEQPSWTTGPPMSLSRGRPGLVASTSGSLWAVGGFASDSLGLVEVYEEATGTWRSATGITARGGLGVASVGGSIYAAGGVTDQTVSLVERLTI